MPTRTVVRQWPRATGETGLQPPSAPIPGAITYEQVPIYASGRGFGGAGWGSEWLGPLTFGQKVWVVSACIRFIAHQVSTLPASVKRNGELVPDPPGWLRNPAPGVYSWFGAAIEAALVSLLGWGNCYLIATEMGSNGYPLSWVVADPSTVIVEVDQGEIRYRWGDLFYNVDEVCHVKWLEQPGSAYGVSPLEGAWSNYLSMQALSSYGRDLAITGAMPYGVLSTEQRLRPGQAVELREQYHSTGATRRGVLVLDGGLKYQQLQLNPKDMALLEMVEADARALCAVFGVPPSLVNVPMADGLTYSTVQGQASAVLSFTLAPVLDKFQGSVSYRFLPGDRELAFNRSRFVQPTALEQMEVHKMAVDSGIYSPEEARAMMGLPQSPVTDPAEVA